MAVDSVFSMDEKQLTITVRGRFDFARHQDFRNAYEGHTARPLSVVVDLQEATYLDSSALGMLLLLRDYAGGDQAQVRLLNASADVQKILAIANFNKLFDIS